MRTLIIITVLVLLNSRAFSQENYVGIELALEHNENLQFFYQEFDTVTWFTQQRSKWRRVKKSESFQLVKWIFPDTVNIRTFRIDLAAVKENEHNTIKISKVEFNLNGISKTILGNDILNNFHFNPFIEVLAADDNYVKIKTHWLDGKLDPFIIFGSKHLLVDSIGLDHPARVSFDLKLKNSDLLQVKVADANGVSLCSGILITSTSKEHYQFEFKLSGELDGVQILPSLHNENFIEISNLQLRSGRKEINWTGFDLLRNLGRAGLYQSVAVNNDILEIDTEAPMSYDSFRLGIAGLVFPKDLLISKIKLTSTILIVSIILFILNKVFFFRGFRGELF